MFHELHTQNTDKHTHTHTDTHTQTERCQQAASKQANKRTCSCACTCIHTYGTQAIRTALAVESQVYTFREVSIPTYSCCKSYDKYILCLHYNCIATILPVYHSSAKTDFHCVISTLIVQVFNSCYMYIKSLGSYLGLIAHVDLQLAALLAGLRASPPPE